MNKLAIISLFSILPLFIHCSRPLEELEGKTFMGSIIRKEDEKNLSEVKFKILKDTLFIFSNAIFGANRDTSLIKHYDKKDSTITLQNLQRTKERKLILYTVPDDTAVVILDDGYYIVAVPSRKDIFESGELSFYRNIQVPYEAYMYLYGGYEGKALSDSDLTNFVLSSFGSIKMKMVFMENFKVKIICNSLMGLAHTKHLSSYHIKGDEVVIEDEDDFRLKITNRGQTLSKIVDGAELVLHKIY